MKENNKILILNENESKSINIKDCESLKNLFKKDNKLNKYTEYSSTRLLPTVLAIILWIHRLFGITFGGLKVDKTGRINRSKVYKYYGYSFLAFNTIIIALYSLNINFNKPKDEIKRQIPKTYNEMKGTICTFIILMGVEYLMTLVMTWYTLFFWNKHGYGLIQFIMNNMKDYIDHKITGKMYLVLLFWIIHLISLAILIIITFGYYTWEMPNIHILGAIILNTELFYFWVTPSITWIISIYSTDILD